VRVLLIRSPSLAADRNMETFRSAGFAADHAGTAEDAFGFIREYPYDIVILEAKTCADACAVIRRIRGVGEATPILVLVDRPSSDLAIDALRAGADDVLGGTYRAEELLARVEAIVRRSHGHATPMLQVGPLTIDASRHRATVNGKDLQLRRKELEVLKLLALRRGRVLSAQQIVDLLYDGDSYPEEGIVRVYICMLRKRLAEHGAGDLLGTVRGYGYVLNPTGPMTSPATQDSIAAPPSEIRLPMTTRTFPAINASFTRPPMEIRPN
jgi:two-component system cell cycle response regulator CtrA